MDHRKEIISEFNKLLQGLDKMELGRQALDPLPVIHSSMAELDKRIQFAFEQFDHQFEAYVEQVNLLGHLIELQRRMTHYRGQQKAADLIFEFLKEQITFDSGFLYFKPLPGASNSVVLADGVLDRTTIGKLLETGDYVRQLEKIVASRDLGVLLAAGHQFNRKKPPWRDMDAESIILFPIRSRDHLMGFGVLVRHASSFPLNHLSFINLTAGILGLFLFQTYSLRLLRAQKAKKTVESSPFDKIKYADYFENGPMFIYTLDESGIVLHVNEAVARRFGGTSHLAGVGESFYSQFADSDQQRIRKMLGAVEEHGQGFSECTIFPESAAPAQWQLYATRLKLKDRFWVYTIFAVDVSERFMENQMQNFHEAMNKARGLSETVLAEVDKMLNALVPGLSLLKSQLSDQPALGRQVSQLQEPVSRIQRMMQIVNNYGLTEIESPQHFDLNQQIIALVKGLAPGAKLDLDEQIKSFVTFPARICQLLELLLRESQISDAPRPVHITTRIMKNAPAGSSQNQKKTWIEIIFSTTDGTEPGLRKPFLNGGFKGSSLREVERFSAYRMIRDLGGEILLGKAGSDGKSIYCYLPLPDTSEEQRQILVVDDEPSIRSALKDILQLEGYQVCTASNGREGVELFSQAGHDFDLVIMDMRMPEMDGKTAFREIRRLKNDQKVVLISGYSQQEDLQELIKNGAAEFIAKPFQVDQVIEKVSAILDNRQVSAL